MVKPHDCSSGKHYSPGDERSAISTSSSSPGSVPTSVPGPGGSCGGGELSSTSSPLCVKALLSLSSNPANLSFSLCLCFFPASLPRVLEFGMLPVLLGPGGGEGDGVGVGVAEAGLTRRAAKYASYDSSRINGLNSSLKLGCTWRFSSGDGELESELGSSPLNSYKCGC